MKIGFAKTGRFGRKAFLALGAAAVATTAVAQTVPDDQTPAAGLDLPANLQLFGKADPNVRKPTAIVNNFVITGTDVDQRVAMVQALNNIKLQGAELDKLRLQILRGLIDETLQIQEAASDKIDVGSDEIDASFARVSAQFGRKPDQMRAWLRSVGSSEKSIKRQIQGELAWNRLLRRRVNIEVSEAEIKAIIDKMKADKGTEEYHLFEINVSAPGDRADQVFKSEQQMIEQMKQGTPFEYLARTYSEATTKSVGGDLGWLRLSMLPDQLKQAAEGMQVGQVAGPIELPGSFSILYLADKRGILTADARDSKLSLKQISLKFPAGATEAQGQELAGKFAEATKTMQGCGDAERVAGLIGAEVVNNDSMKVKDLPPALQNMILALTPGQATQPFGSLEDGVRVLVLCGREDATTVAEPNADAIENDIVEKKTNVRAARMLRDLRRDALIEYR